MAKFLTVGRGNTLVDVPAEGNQIEHASFRSGQAVGMAAGIGWVPFKCVFLAGKALLDGAAESSFGQGVQYGFHQVDRAVDVEISKVKNRGMDINEIKGRLIGAGVLKESEAKLMSERALRAAYSDTQTPNKWVKVASRPARVENNNNATVTDFTEMEAV